MTVSVAKQTMMQQHSTTHLIGLTATSNKIIIHAQPNKVLLIVVAIEDSGSSANFGVPQAQGAVCGG